MDSRHVMALDPLSLVDSPKESRAISSEPDLPPSMEDTDNSLKRKRPRLDSGDRAATTMSAEQLNTPSSKSEPSPQSPSSALTDTERVRDGQLVNLNASTHLSTPSKVTINVRPPQPDGLGGESDPTETTGVQPEKSDSIMTNAPSSPSLAITNLPTDEVSTSPHSRSPEIEVAEVEDMDSDNNGSDWPYVVNVIGEDERGPDLLDQFPYADRTPTLIDTVRWLGSILEKGDIGDGEVILELTSWFTTYLNYIERPNCKLSFLDDHEFWMEVPQLFESLLRRRNHFGPQFVIYPSVTSQEGGARLVENFFKAFVRLALKFLQMDIHVLEKSSPTDNTRIEFCSHRYLQILSWVTKTTEIPLWTTLIKQYNVAASGIVFAVADKLLAAPLNGFYSVLQIAAQLFRHICNRPFLFTSAYSVINIAKNLLLLASNKRSACGEDILRVPDRWRNFPKEALKLFRRIDVEIQTCVPKLPSSLSADFGKDLINLMKGLLRDSAHADHTMAVPLFQEIVGSFDEARPEDLADLTAIAWKFKLLKKYVTEGRMELRVQGMDALQQDLVAAWNKFAKTNEVGINHPIMQYLASFILDNKLVDYIVGIDSHPQLIARSGNIVGFLVVTFKYTSHESDAIWHTVATSQDPRVVGAILTMLGGILTNCEYGVLIYLCTKLNELPLGKFDAQMIDYGIKLLHHIREKFRSARSEEHLDTPPYDLCIRLIRQAAVVQGQPNANVDSVSQFALGELAHLLQWGPGEEDRRLIYKECVRDIAEKSPTATGSICAINALLLHRPNSDTAMLTEEMDLARLVVEELALFVREQREKGLPSVPRKYAIPSRLDLLYNIIVYKPATITPELGDLMWDSLWGEGALGEQERELAWTKLIGALDALRKPNNFLSRCMTIYLPRLDPSLFTMGVLAFLQRAIDYQIRAPSAAAETGQDMIDIPGAEQVWRPILTAPSDDIGVNAIKLLVGVYLDSPIVSKAPKLLVEATHIALVDRCVRQLTSAASKLKAFSDGTTSGEDEPMVIVASDAEIQAQELYFHRSLLFLREITHEMRSRPQYSPQLKQVDIAEPSLVIKGERLRLPYQAFTGNSQTVIHDFDIGDLETLEGLVERLKILTQFSELKIIVGGRFLDLVADRTKTLRELKIVNKGLLMVRKIEDVKEAQEVASIEPATVVELEVSKHFDDLYNLLGLEEILAREIYDFITAFPPQQKICQMVVNNATPSSEIFPIGQSYKSLYSINALQTCLKEQLQKGIHNENFIAHGVRTMLSAIMDTRIIEAASSDQLKLSIAAKIVQCLLAFLKEPVLPETTASYFTDESTLVNRLVTLLKTTISNFAYKGAVPIILARQCFATIVEASLHSSVIWEVFIKRPDVTELLSDLLIETSSRELRAGIADTIMGVCVLLPRATRVSAEHFSSYFWRGLSDILPQTDHYRGYSQEFFNLALSVFRTVADFNPGALDLNSYIRTWGGLLARCKSEEYVGRAGVDCYLFGLTNLLKWAVQLAKSSKKPLQLGNSMEEIFAMHLFPDLSPYTTTSSITPHVPALQSQTRQVLYELTLSLVQDEQSYRTLLGLVSELVSEGGCSPDHSWGISNASKDYDYGTMWNLDRSKIIRSSTGYAGLKNLSNTCYLNSLFTQLFMNVSFRKFMLEANIADGDGSQKLLSETKNLFAHMQDSWQKMVDPKDLADSIRTYENEMIDVTIQMDVDEFYNLLFDRWEGQILSPEAKRVFRSFYGGQLVQQVKSKECPHVSEREEPFSAVQCDIKGKSTLQESLKAYVEGEIMEGDNKYSCTSCGRHVDAVKRTCLKVVPNNLMFHLKRFDFDLVSMQRSKINDRFEFPDEIDMKPYKIDHLGDPEGETSEDVFKLVGVLVHSGTAESGHYYSYVKERPAADPQSNSWVEYNDADVSEFDPGKIPEQCFGGTNDSVPALHQLGFTKAWSAYMLFYQRRSTLDAEQKESLSVHSNYPVKFTVPEDMGNYIALENELFIRNYCLFDPVHGPFVRSIVEQLRHLNKGSCSEDHAIEQEAISLALDHMNQVFSRTKDLSDWDGMMSLLTKVIGACAECCKLTLDWIVKRPLATRNLLLRHPTTRVRADYAKLIITALGYLRRMDPQLYGPELIDSDTVVAEWTSSDGAFRQVLEAILHLWSFIDMHLRSWEEYFGLLSELAALGCAETTTLLCTGVLRRCLEILTVEGGQRPANQVRLLKALEKGRKPNYTQLLRLVRDLLVMIDLNECPVTDEFERTALPVAEKYPLTEYELAYLRMPYPKAKPLVLLSKMIECMHNASASSDVIRMILQATPDLNLVVPIYHTIMAGISIDPASLAVPYLNAALTFCEYCPTAAEAKDLVSRAARDVETIDVQGGQDNLHFFYSLLTIRNNRVDNDPLGYRYLVLENVHHWAPPLLLYWEEKVRSDTTIVLNSLIFDYAVPVVAENSRLSRSIERAVRLLGKSCVKQVQAKFVAARATVEAKTITEIVDTIRKCMEYFNGDFEEDDQDLLSCQAALQHLEALAVEEVDDAASEWDNEDSYKTSESDVDVDGI